VALCHIAQGAEEWHMRNRCQRLLLVVIGLLGAALGGAKQGLAQTITEFPIPTAGSNPMAITTGPDGALWFDEASTSANNIGRITTAGVFTEFPIPTAGSDPRECRLSFQLSSSW